MTRNSPPETHKALSVLSLGHPSFAAIPTTLTRLDLLSLSTSTEPPTPFDTADLPSRPAEHALPDRPLNRCLPAPVVGVV
ncbi:hypothetical protein BV25DRAFT_1823541 [Artomyces pyxidatus]|uniref:Uncharacterized protein n=1 Tax=Artomyces pyxidatus TaxID=48021 RepID=A0ACB8T676_9AGAM|nr:hypothetical protein BV25DRAFT_1823541 [Artomyces pyxidatus]